MNYTQKPRLQYGKELRVNRPLLNRSKEHGRLLHILWFISSSQWGEILKTIFECEYNSKRGIIDDSP